MAIGAVHGPIKWRKWWVNFQIDGSCIPNKQKSWLVQSGRCKWLWEFTKVKADCMGWTLGKGQKKMSLELIGTQGVADSEILEAFWAHTAWIYVPLEWLWIVGGGSAHLYLAYLKIQVSLYEIIWCFVIKSLYHIHIIIYYPTVSVHGLVWACAQTQTDRHTQPPPPPHTHTHTIPTQSLAF